MMIPASATPAAPKSKNTSPCQVYVLNGNEILVNALTVLGTLTSGSTTDATRGTIHTDRSRLPAVGSLLSDRVVDSAHGLAVRYTVSGISDFGTVELFTLLVMREDLLSLSPTTLKKTVPTAITPRILAMTR